MSVRSQTGTMDTDRLNGREWFRRSLGKPSVGTCCMETSSHWSTIAQAQKRLDRRLTAENGRWLFAHDFPDGSDAWPRLRYCAVRKGDVNHRFMEQMATVRNDTPLRDVLKDITRPFTLQGHRVRALDITGKDRELLLALVDPQYTVCGITNKRLQETLRASPWAKGRTDKQLSARLSRHLRLLREHGLIRKLPNQRKYLLTETGRTLTCALAALLAASTQQLMEKAA